LRQAQYPVDILDSLYTTGGASSDDVRTRGTDEAEELQAGSTGTGGTGVEVACG
jgi:hypothetical protein